MTSFETSWRLAWGKSDKVLKNSAVLKKSFDTEGEMTILGTTDLYKEYKIVNLSEERKRKNKMLWQGKISDVESFEFVQVRCKNYYDWTVKCCTYRYIRGKQNSLKKKAIKVKISIPFAKLWKIRKIGKSEKVQKTKMRTVMNWENIFDGTI